MQSKTTSEETLRVDLPQYTCDSLREASKNLFPSQAWRANSKAIFSKSTSVKYSFHDNHNYLDHLLKMGEMKFGYHTQVITVE